MKLIEVKRMNNDWISRSAIKRELMKAFNCEDATKYGNKDAKQLEHSYSTILLYEVADIIKDTVDNAPTVDTTFREVVAYECGQKSVEERPKGKWIEERDKRGHLITRKCPICKAFHDGMIINFCPNCGADMRGDV